MKYPTVKEIVLGDLPEINVPEIQVSYSRDGRPFLGKISSYDDMSKFLRSTYDPNIVELQEQTVVLYLGPSNEIIGYYRHSKGGITTVTADLRIIMATALKCGCVALLISHNHPSGNLRPSDEDLKLTNHLKKLAETHSLLLVDHIIITKNSFYSFFQNKIGQLSGLPRLKNDADGFVAAIDNLLGAKTPHNKKSVEKLAASYGITDKTHVKELTELAIVKRARILAHSPGTIRERFDNIVELYNSQVNLSHRTSQSILLQQYSTPAPIAYLAGVFCGIDSFEPGKEYFEPSAGNGLLTIAGYPNAFVVNEIDSFRNQNLLKQKFKKVTKQDATQPFNEYHKVFDAIITNPPFGVSEKEIMYDTFRIVSLEHVMALRALDCMKDFGSAAIIIGSHTRWDDKGRIQAGKNRIFFNYLYSRYNVVDVIMIDGHKLYSRQGTAFDVRLILIDGRKEMPTGNAPVYNPAIDVVVSTFDQLFDRVMDAKELAIKSMALGSRYLPVYKKYASIKSQYPDSILLLEDGAEYFIFGSDALKLLRETDFIGAGEIEYHSEKIRMIRFPFASLQTHLNKVRKAGYIYKVVDQSAPIKNDDMKLLELEAEALELELQLLKTNFEKGLGAIIPGNVNHNNYKLYLNFRNRYEGYFKILVVIKNSITGNYETFGLDAERFVYMFSVPFTFFELIKGKKVYGIELNENKFSEIKKKLYDAGYVVAIIEDTELDELNGINYDLSGTNYIDRSGWANDKKMFKEWARLKKAYPDAIIFLEEATTFQTYNEDAIKYYNVKKKYDFRNGPPRFYATCAIYDHGVWFCNQGILREEKPLIEHLLIDAGYRPLFIENELAHYRWPTRPELEQYELMMGQAHNAKDKMSYSQWIQKKDHSTKNILLIKQGARLYVTWEEDATIIKEVMNANFWDDKSIKNTFGEIINGGSFPVSKLKLISDHLGKEGYKIVIVDQTLGSLHDETLEAPYEPASNACVKLDTQVPDSMAYETHSAINQIKQEVGGDIDNFVRHRLKYPTKVALCKVLSAEQIDAVAMAIYNVEAKNQGMIIGDQTGIGKGRVAAAMIRYGVLHGMKPVFLTEKANLFSDIYRDLSAIGSAHLKPFIVNGREPKTDIKDEDGNVIYTAPAPEEQRSIIQSREVPASYDFVVATYSQFNSKDKKPEKPNFLNAIAADNLFIMDEAHNSSGSGNTGEFLQGVIRHTRGVVFLSATFAKRPDNMPIYSLKTAISDCNMTRDDLVEAISRGGVALQEVLSSQLVGEGQMLRRERSFEGVEVNYITLEDKAQEHKAIADNITEILRDIIAFQGSHVDKEVEDLDKIAVAESKEVTIREGTSQAGVDNLPYFSKVFNVINQMLFSLKAETVAEKSIERLKEGKKVVIAFASTMGSFIETMENDQGMPVGDGDTINSDFSEVLKRGLEGILRYSEKDIDGNAIHKKFDVSDFTPAAQMEYHRIMEKIQEASTGITISPIDVVIKKIRKAGYSVAEVTGRKYEMQLNDKGSKALVLARKKVNTNDAFRQFNNNEVDVLMINQSGSTGASAHAIPTAKVPKDQVKQRVMIVLQAELDISTEVQKRGRINRTGQILKPIYDYVSSAIPAEKRLMMMLQKKLKSLDANTTSNQKQSSKILDVPDFLNKYGDKLAKEYLLENPAVNKLLDDPLYLEDSKSDSSRNSNPVEDAAMKVSGRVAVLSTKMQEDFYTDIAERYNDYVEYLKQVGEYDLEVEAMNLEAETISAKVIKMGKGGDSAFGDDSMLETVKANVLKKPFTKSELENLIKESLKDKGPHELQKELLEEYNSSGESKLAEMLDETNGRYDQLIKDIPNEKKIKKLEGNQPAWQQAIKQREKELNEARDIQLKNTEKNFNNRKNYIEKILKFYFVGRLLHYHVDSFGNGSEEVPAVFVGFMIDSKKKNPYAPSAIKLRFAIANSSKYLAMPASYSEEIMAIIGASAELSQPGMDDLLNKWETYTKENNVDRKIRHIVTGNLLQAFSDMKGKLVSYTTIDKQVKKGILLPENWNPGEEVQDNVVVPIMKALPIIKSITQGKHIVTNSGLSIFRQSDHFKLIIAASRARGGDIYLDKQILELVENSNFEKTSDKMVAMLPEKNVRKLVELLQTNHSSSITIQSYQLKDLEKEAIRSTNRKQIELPPVIYEGEEDNLPDNVIFLLELEAEALTLELQLLAA